MSAPGHAPWVPRRYTWAQGGHTEPPCRHGIGPLAAALAVVLALVLGGCGTEALDDERPAPASSERDRGPAAPNAAETTPVSPTCAIGPAALSGPALVYAVSTSRVAHLVGQALEVYSGAVWRDGDTIAARSWRLGDICLVEARTLMLFADGESVLVSSGMVVPVPH